MIADVTRLQSALGYSYNNSELLREALTHRSAGGNNNERLEYLGDAVLGMLVAEELFRRFPDASEGQMSRMRASVVRGESLAEIAQGLGIGDYIQLGPGELKSGGFRRASILADTLEALLGAIYLDAGIEACRKFVTQHFATYLDRLTPDIALKDPKTRLQEYLQSRQLNLPQYVVTEIKGDAHDQDFTVECTVPGIDPVIATGKSRRKAEQAAARMALKAFEV